MIQNIDFKTVKPKAVSNFAKSLTDTRLNNTFSAVTMLSYKQEDEITPWQNHVISIC